MPLDSQLCNVWPVNTTAACWKIPADVPAERITLMQRVASDYLWMRTGRRLGPSCPVTVRPCRKTCFEGYGYGRFLNQGQYQSTGGWIPYMADGQMRNATLCGCASECHCGPELCEIRLPGPVYDVTDVKINGVTVPSETYRVDDGQYLTRLTTGAAADEARCWPSCQDMTRRDSEENTFAVTYRSGLGLSGIATLAVTELTAHLIRGCADCDGCGSQTRQNLARISRQGVDLEFVDPQTLFNDDRTGIQIVDWFIQSANPHKLGSAMRVLSPDAPKRPRIQGNVV
jgi:hypothetical protein